MFHVEVTDDIAVLRLRHGKVNALDVEFFRAFEAELAELPARGVRGLVMTSARPVFSAGLDIVRLVDASPVYADELIATITDAIGALFILPIPTVAAVNGPAVAGGCLLACACDRRVVADDAPLGLTELGVGIPFPAISLAVAAHLLGPRLERVLHAAELYRGADAVAVGLADEAVPGADVLPRAVAEVRRLAAIPAAAFRITKAQARYPALAAAAACDLDRDVAAAWVDPSTAERLRTSLGRASRPGRPTESAGISPDPTKEGTQR